MINDTPEQRLNIIQNKIRELCKKAKNLEKEINEENDNLKEKLGINISRIESILDKYRKMYIDLKEDIERTNSYGGPDPTGGTSTLLAQGKMDLLEEIILSFDREIYKAIDAHKQENQYE